jgi:hypothetical protein
MDVTVGVGHMNYMFIIAKSQPLYYSSALLIANNSSAKRVA